MAITVHSSPQPITPAYNPVKFLVSSSNSGQSNFRYVFDIYASDETTLLARVKLPARPSDNYCYFDAKRILENLVSYDLGATGEAADFYQNTQSYYKYLITIGEEYGATPTVYPDLYIEDFNDMYIWNAAVSNYDFRDYVDWKYAIIYGDTGFCQTEAPQRQSIELDQNALLYMISLDADAAKTGIIKKYSSAGVLLGTLTITNTYAALTNHADHFLRFACGTSNINNHTPGWIDSNVSYYTVHIEDADDYVVSPVYTYTITENCRFETFRFHFLNTRGGFDSFNFTMKSSERHNINRNSYRQNHIPQSGTETRFLYHNRGNTVFNTETEKSYTVYSDWITEAESAWLAQLVSSPEVFLEKDGALYAVDILNNDYTPQKKVNQKLFNIPISFKFSTNDNKQRG